MAAEDIFRTRTAGNVLSFCFRSFGQAGGLFYPGTKTLRQLPGAACGSSRLSGLSSVIALFPMFREVEANRFNFFAGTETEHSFHDERDHRRGND
jgi:hypothetical protein